MSIYNRPYMRPEPNPQGDDGWAMRALVVGLLAVFVLQNIVRHWFGQVPPSLPSGFERAFALSLDNLQTFRIDTLITYAFLHNSTGFPAHLIVNLVVLYFCGRPVLQQYGSDRFIDIFLFTSLLGGLCWLAVSMLAMPNRYLLGASGAGFGLLSIALFHNWHQRVGLLFLPIMFQGRHLFYAFLGVSAFLFLFAELPVTSRDGVAHSAHLGGMLGGFLYFRHLSSRGSLTTWVREWIGGRVSQARREKVATPATKTRPRFKVNITDRSKLRQEVDRILDKINSEGFGALTDEEKETLDRAKDALK